MVCGDYNQDSKTQLVLMSFGFGNHWAGLRRSSGPTCIWELPCCRLARPPRNVISSICRRMLPPCFVQLRSAMSSWSTRFCRWQLLFLKGFCNILHGRFLLRSRGQKWTWTLGILLCTGLEPGTSSTTWLHSFSKASEWSLDGYVKSTPNGNLPQACRGRAKRLAPLLRTAQAVTVKASRRGEEALCSDFLGSKVTKWFKQLRRLQSLRQALDANKQTAAAQAYRLALWQSIKRATGFAVGFASWWPTRPLRLQGSPIQ